MPSTTVLIAVLIPFHTVTATVFTALNTVVTTDLMAFSTVDIFVLTASQTVLITVFMVFMTVEITDATALITVETVLFIVFHTEIMVSLQFSPIQSGTATVMDIKCCFQKRTNKQDSYLYHILDGLPYSGKE